MVCWLQKYMVMYHKTAVLQVMEHQCSRVTFERPVYTDVLVMLIAALVYVCNVDLLGTLGQLNKLSS